MKRKNSPHILEEIFILLYKYYGPRKWWPADSAFEVIIGAILTQNTSWKNVERAIQNLKSKKVLSIKRLAAINERVLAKLIKSSGFFNQKAKRIKAFVNYLIKTHKGSIKDFSSAPTKLLRQELLGIKGIGHETADSILLYACNHPVFVIDAYTKRILLRMGLVEEGADYQKLQDFFHKNLSKNRRLFNEYHALIVEHGKNICKKRPACSQCVLKRSCKLQAQKHGVLR